jgi:hypothetical protein
MALFSTGADSKIRKFRRVSSMPSVRNRVRYVFFIRWLRGINSRGYYVATSCCVYIVTVKPRQTVGVSKVDQLPSGRVLTSFHTIEDTISNNMFAYHQNLSCEPELANLPYRYSKVRHRWSRLGACLVRDPFKLYAGRTP